MTNPILSQPIKKFIADRYKVIKTLSGGMGLIYLCLDTQQNDFPVALKTFKPEYLPDQNTRERFLREASVWVEIGWHPNIVQAYRTEYVTSTHEIYILLEMLPPLPGKNDPSLRTLMIPGVGIKVEKTLKIALDTTRGMKYATTKVPGLIHRDLKPENILIGPDGSARITDFGIIAVLPNEYNNQAAIFQQATHITLGPVGTPLYMSPEQWLNKSVTQSSDIYSFGCVTLEMLTGNYTILGRNPQSIVEMHIKGDAIRRLGESHLPSAMTTFLSMCLQPDPLRRFQTWELVEKELATLYDVLLHKKVEPENINVDVSLRNQLQKGESVLAIGEAYLDISETEAAIKCFEQAKSIGKSQNYLELSASAEANIGIACFNLGQYINAISHYQSAIAQHMASGNIEYAILNNGNIGNAYFQLGDFTRAKDNIEKVLEHAKDIGDERMFAFWSGNLANVISNLGNDRKALEYYSDALEVARKYDDHYNESKMLASIGIAYDRLNEMQKSQSAFEQALVLAHQLGDQQTIMSVFFGLSHLYTKQGNVQKSVDTLLNALDVAKRINNLGMIAQAQGDLGISYSMVGKYDDAIKHLMEALQVAEQIQARQVEARAHWSLGFTYELKMDFNNAIKHLRIAVILFKELKLPEYSIAQEHLNELRKHLGLL